MPLLNPKMSPDARAFLIALLTTAAMVAAVLLFTGCYARPVREPLCGPRLESCLAPRDSAGRRR